MGSKTSPTPKRGSRSATERSRKVKKYELPQTHRLLLIRSDLRSCLEGIEEKENGLQRIHGLLQWTLKHVQEAFVYEVKQSRKKRP